MGRGGGASGIALTPDGHYAIVANTSANTITRIDLTTIPPTVSPPLAVPAGPTQVAISPNGSTAYVTSFTGNAVTVVNVSPFALGPQIALAAPWGDTVSPDGSTLWVTSPSLPGRGGVVYEISTASNTVLQTLFLGQNDPHGVTEIPDQSKVFVADNTNNSVTEILTGSPPTVGPTIPAGPGELELASTPDSTTVFTTDNGASTDTPIATAGPAPGPAIPADTAPYGIALTQPLVRTCPTPVPSGSEPHVHLAAGARVVGPRDQPGLLATFVPGAVNRGGGAYVIPGNASGMPTGRQARSPG